MNAKATSTSAKPFTPEPVHPSEILRRKLVGDVESAWALMRDDRRAADAMLTFVRYLEPSDYMDETTHQRVMLFLLRSQSMILKEYETMLCGMVHSKEDRKLLYKDEPVMVSE